MGHVLVRGQTVAEPRIVRDVREQVRPVEAVVARQVGEDRLVADQDADRCRTIRDTALGINRPRPNPPEVLESGRPVWIQEGDALDDRNQIFLVIRRLRAAMIPVESA